MQIKIPVYPINGAKGGSIKRGIGKFGPAQRNKWRLAYRYGITIQELERLNPQIKDGLKIGQEIVIPKRTVEETKALEESFNYYKVAKRRILPT